MNETKMNEQPRTAKLKETEDGELTEMNLDNVSGGAPKNQVLCWMCNKYHDAPACKAKGPSTPNL